MLQPVHAHAHCCFHSKCELLTSQKEEAGFAILGLATRLYPRAICVYANPVWKCLLGNAGHLKTLFSGFVHVCVVRVAFSTTLCRAIPSGLTDETFSRRSPDCGAIFRGVLCSHHGRFITGVGIRGGPRFFLNQTIALRGVGVGGGGKSKRLLCWSR